MLNSKGVEKTVEVELENMKATREVYDDGLYDGEGENGSRKTF